METCSVSGRFCATDLRFGRMPRYFVGERSPTTTSFFLRCSPETSFFLRCSSAGVLSHETETPESVSPNRMFIMGLGFVGKFFGRDLTKRGWAVSGSCTSLMKKKKLEEVGFDVHLFDANEPELEVLNILNRQTHLLASIPPLIGCGDPMLQHEELLKSKLVDGNIKWLGYLSSTSVYGDCGGMWVDEDYLVNPTNEKAEARLAAEEGWLKLGHDLGISVQIFRLGGIYGPGRSAVDTLTKQEALSKTQRMRASKHYTSRVHVADICQALRASIDKPFPGKIYNVVDDDPASRIEVFSYAWNLVDRKWPGHMKQTSPLYGTAESFSTETSSRREEKRVSNARIKNELGVRLLHPSYKSGLKSIIENMGNPFHSIVL